MAIYGYYCTHCKKPLNRLDKIELIIRHDEPGRMNGIHQTHKKKNDVRWILCNECSDDFKKMMISFTNGNEGKHNA